jgi:conjugative transfer region protein TrbK
MKTTALDQMPRLAAVLLIVLLVAACAIRLRSDEGQPTAPSSERQTSDPLASKLAECRSVTYDQKDALAECRKAWDEKRRQFLDQRPAATSVGRPEIGSPLFVAPKDESRRSDGIAPTLETGKE